MHISSTLSPPGQLGGMLALGRNRAFVFYQPVPPDYPAWLPFLDLGRQQSFVFAVIPLPDFLSDDMVGCLRNMVEQEVERPVGADPRRDEDSTDVLRINDSYAIVLSWILG